MARFSEDWVGAHVEHWRSWLGSLASQENVIALEVGSFEGRSALWFLENILTSASAKIVCVDPFAAPCFQENIAPFVEKVQWIRELSHVALRALPSDAFDFIYIDGEHEAPFVLEDAVLAFRLLKPGGIMIFDDYRWKSDLPECPHTMPRIAIDAFLNIYQAHLDNIEIGRQVKIRKKSTIA